MGFYSLTTIQNIRYHRILNPLYHKGKTRPLRPLRVQRKSFRYSSFDKKFIIIHVKHEIVHTCHPERSPMESDHIEVKIFFSVKIKDYSIYKYPILVVFLSSNPGGC